MSAGRRRRPGRLYFPMQKAGLSSKALIRIDFPDAPDSAWTYSWTRKRRPSRDGAPWIMMACASDRQYRKHSLVAIELFASALATGVHRRRMQSAPVVSSRSHLATQGRSDLSQFGKPGEAHFGLLAVAVPTLG